MMLMKAGGFQVFEKNSEMKAVVTAKFDFKVPVDSDDGDETVVSLTMVDTNIAFEATTSNMTLTLKL